jgi:hypothetical protein
MVLRTIFQCKRKEVTRYWRKLRNEELHYFYCSLNIVRAIKSRRMIRAGHVARILEKINLHRVLVGKPERNNPFGNTSGGCKPIPVAARSKA